MKIALLGRGKTGGEVLKLNSEHEIIGPFHREHTPTAEKLKVADAILVFLPGEALVSYLPLLQEVARPLVIGSTGIPWPKDYPQKFQRGNFPVCWGRNFSIGINVLKPLIEILSNFQQRVAGFEPSLIETHHVHKKDAPSGTALMLQEWWGRDLPILSEREGDIVGIHRLELRGEMESIELSHTAHDRSLFAQGALWACEKLGAKNFPTGFFTFESLIENEVLAQLREKR